jgi:hypothetical protein
MIFPFVSVTRSSPFLVPSPGWTAYCGAHPVTCPLLLV